jgi:hypothetical protein
MIVWFNLEPIESEVDRLAAMEQEKLLGLVLGLQFLNSYPDAGSRMVGQPRDLMWAELHSIARSSLELDKVKLPPLITSNKIRDTRESPRLKPRRRQIPRHLGHPVLHLFPKGALSLSRGCRNCSFLLE